MRPSISCAAGQPSKHACSEARRRSALPLANWRFRGLVALCDPHKQSEASTLAKYA